MGRNLPGVEPNPPCLALPQLRPFKPARKDIQIEMDVIRSTLDHWIVKMLKIPRRSLLIVVACSRFFEDWRNFGGFIDCFWSFSPLLLRLFGASVRLLKHISDRSMMILKPRGRNKISIEC